MHYGVIFDMDGVLVDSYTSHLESWRQLARQLDMTMTEDQFAATFGRTSRAIIRELFAVTDEQTIRRYDQRKEALYRDIIREQVPEMPGAVALVKQLHEAGYHLAVGSSGPPENIALVCEAMELDAYFSVRVTGMDVTRGKPDPQVFLIAAQRLGLEPKNCVVIEDAPSGVEAAGRAGMACIALIGAHDGTALSAAQLVVSKLSEIDVDVIRSCL